jgi:hypothetical protein
MRKLTTGEPYAGEPHVRFGGRGGESLPYPYRSLPDNPERFAWRRGRADRMSALPQEILPQALQARVVCFCVPSFSMPSVMTSPALR